MSRKRAGTHLQHAIIFAAKPGPAGSIVHAKHSRIQHSHAVINGKNQSCGEKATTGTISGVLLISTKNGHLEEIKLECARKRPTQKKLTANIRQEHRRNQQIPQLLCVFPFQTQLSLKMREFSSNHAMVGDGTLPKFVAN